MIPVLRPYQVELSDRIDSAWAEGHRNICAVLPTGGGKTVIFAEKLRGCAGVSFAIAHRQELISQMSLTLARYGVSHGIIAQPTLIRYIISLHTKELGRHFYNPDSQCIVAGVRSLLNRAERLKGLINRAELVVQDEGHHCLRSNEWGKAFALFPRARGLLVTATPERADGRGLGCHAEGIIDTIVSGPGMRELVRGGYLTDYRIFGPYTDIDLSGVTVSGATGDYSKPKLIAAVRKSRIVGDVVTHYLRIAPGKLGVTFVPDVNTGKDIAAAYKAQGVPAAMIHAKTPDRERQEATARLARGDLKNLVNVDIFGEGYDLPAIEVGSMARPTESYPLYAQQFGRTLRPMEGKQSAIIIDHVGNVKRHGLPDAHREWSLDSKDRRGGKRDGIPIRTCRQCTAVYESWVKDCPYCGWKYAPEACGTIEQVDGDLTEVDPSILAALRGEVERIDAPDYVAAERLKRGNAPPEVVGGFMKNHRRRQEAQAGLRATIAQWAGYPAQEGLPDRAIMEKFYISFGVDIMTAKTLNARKAIELQKNIWRKLYNV